MTKKKSSRHFKFPSGKQQQGTSLRINQQLMSTPSIILATCEEHFRTLSATIMSTSMVDMKGDIMTLMTASLKYEDSLLDAPFSVEKNDAILKKLKLGQISWTQHAAS